MNYLIVGAHAKGQENLVEVIESRLPGKYHIIQKS
jgi:hypothetical protein